MTRFRTALVGALLLCACTAAARVISYAPYSDRNAFPGVQNRMNRHFAVVEGPAPGYSGPMIVPVPYYTAVYGQVVVYDSSGEQEPRVVFPQDGTLTPILALAVRENAAHVPVIFVSTIANAGSATATQQPSVLLSNDGGTTWRHVVAPDGVAPQMAWTNTDTGGPFVHGTDASVAIGPEDFPFVFAAGDAVYAVSRDAVALRIGSGLNPVTILGSNRAATRFAIRSGAGEISTIGIDGSVGSRYQFDATGMGLDTPRRAWLRADGSMYLELQRGAQIILRLVTAAGATDLITGDSWNGETTGVISAPSADYEGAWVATRGMNKPAELYRVAGAGVEKEWTDATGPLIEALIAGASGRTVLIQVHRTRPQADQRIFKDPALAVWSTGDGAPAAYDELYLNETPWKGFVHVDADRIASGDPFVFDSGGQMGVPPPDGGGIIISPFPGGGSDVTQEWGIVRASLQQRLVLPGIGRIPGAYGSFWQSDVVLYNPLPAVQNVTVRWVPNSSGPVVDGPQQVVVTLQPAEIRVVRDALKTLFGYDSGNGAFFLEPEIGVNATSRTYTRTDAGSYGFGMNAIDVFSATRPRFPVTFSGAFQGNGFRTNLVLTDVSGRGTTAAAMASGTSGAMGSSNVTFTAARNGQQQINSVSAQLGLLPSDTGALRVEPASGEAIAAVYTIDDRTNDPTYFPPDLPAPTVRTIPIIGHVDGANGAKFRSDLFLYNPAPQTRVVTLQVKALDVPETPAVLSLTLLPNEARVIRDVLFTAFGKTGLARLRYQSGTDASSVRVTSRTYTVDANGGTYGFLMPPLNNFQIAGPGDTLEILGAIGDHNFRTNLALVELTGVPTGRDATAKVEIVDDAGRTIDSFEVSVPISGGMQLADLFHARNLGDGPPAALIRVRPISGMIGAFATLIDNGTNDPTYLAAQLGAK